MPRHLEPINQSIAFLFCQIEESRRHPSLQNGHVVSTKNSCECWVGVERGDLLLESGGIAEVVRILHRKEFASRHLHHLVDGGGLPHVLLEDPVNSGVINFSLHRMN